MSVNAGKDTDCLKMEDLANGFILATETEEDVATVVRSCETPTDVYVTAATDWWAGNLA